MSLLNLLCILSNKTLYIFICSTNIYWAPTCLQLTINSNPTWTLKFQGSYYWAQTETCPCVLFWLGSQEWEEEGCTFSEQWKLMRKVILQIWLGRITENLKSESWTSLNSHWDKLSRSRVQKHIAFLRLLGLDNYNDHPGLGITIEYFVSLKNWKAK